MGVDKITEDSAERNKGCYHFDRHTSDCREQFLNITHRLMAAGDRDGRRAEKWNVYSEPAHASVYTPENSPAIETRAMNQAMRKRTSDEQGLARADHAK